MNASLGSAPNGSCFNGTDYSVADITPRERQVMTSRWLREVGELQIAMVHSAIEWRGPFERWIGRLLRRHWQMVLNREKKVAFVWCESVANTRSRDIYYTHGADIEPSSTTQISKLAQHLEAWLLRYLLYCLDEEERSAAIHALGLIAYGAKSELGNKLTLYLEEHLRTHANTYPDAWNANAISIGIYGLLHWEYIAKIEDYCERARAKKLLPISKRVVDLFDHVIRVNNPALLKSVHGFLDSVGVQTTAMDRFDDLTAAAMRAALDACGRFDFRTGNTFAPYCKRVIQSELRREYASRRCVGIPEEVAFDLRRYRIWASEHQASAVFSENVMKALTRHELWLESHSDLANLPIEAQLLRAGVGMTVEAFLKAKAHPQYIPLSKQIQDAGVRMGLKDFVEAHDAEESTNLRSIEALRDGDGGESADRQEIMVSDGGAGADATRGAGADEDEVFARALRRLTPLQQAILHCFLPGAHADGGDLAWLLHVRHRGISTVELAAARIQRGVATAPASEVVVGNH